MTDLKPCPFCQGSASAEGVGGGNVGCDDSSCPAYIINCSTLEWNTRHEAAKVSEQPDDCRKAFDVAFPEPDYHREDRIIMFKAYNAAWCHKRESVKFEKIKYWLDRAINHWKEEERGINVEFCIKAALNEIEGERK